MPPKIVAFFVFVLSLTLAFAAPGVTAAPATLTTTLSAGPLSAPSGVAVADDGTLYIADTNNNRVQVITFDAGGNPETPTTLNTGTLAGPSDITIDEVGNLYIADTILNRVQKVTFDTGGNPTTTTLNTGTLTGPRGVTIADGTLYIADTSSNRIQVVTFNADGDPETPTTLAAGTLSQPYKVAVTSDGTIYISETGGNRIRSVTFDANGAPKAPTTLAAGTLFAPIGLTISDDGDLYIADAVNNRIQVVAFDAAGNPTTTTLDTGGLAIPRGLTFDNDGDLYIADTNNNLIQVVTFDSTNPTISITDPGPLRVASPASWIYSCADTNSTGIASCTATNQGHAVNNGQPIDASNRGSQTLTVTALDNAGNTTTESLDVSIAGQREITGVHAGSSDHAGSITRLYMATFTRNPDAVGFSYWEARYDSGADLQNITDFFTTSPEFSTRYGEATDLEFVELVYRNIMNRPSDDTGFNYWVHELENDLSRTRLLLLFSESPEFKTITHTS